MRAPNGCAHGRDATTTMSRPPPTAKGMPATRYSVERVKQLVTGLEVPFDPSQIEGRVMNTTKNRQPVRGQAIHRHSGRKQLIRTPRGFEFRRSRQSVEVKTSRRSAIAEVRLRRSGRLGYLSVASSN